MRDRMLLFHSPKYDRPLRRGMCETEGKGKVLVEILGTELLVFGEGRGLKEGGCR
jgi:hypothetical protein